MTIRVAGRNVGLSWFALAAIIAVGAFFRFHDLGECAFRGDTILLWNMALRKVPPGLLLTQWFEVSGAAGQMPMPAFLMQLFLDLCGWPLTAFWVRVPFAFFGVLAIPAAFFGGRKLFGTTFGLVLAALLAVNSFHIATARESYFYSTLLFGYFLYFWSGAAITERLIAGEALRKGDLAILAAAIFFSAYSQITGLLICAAAGLLFFGLLFRRQRKLPVFKKNLTRLIVVHAILFAPVVVASWGLRPLLAQIGANRERGAEVVAMSGYNLFRGVTEALEQFSWGWTGPRVALLVVVCVAAILAFIRNREWRGLWLLYFIVAEIVLFSISRTASGANYEARYMSGFFPFFLAALAYGLLCFPKAVASGGVERGLATGFVALGLGACLYPAYLQTQSTGAPAPYYDLIRWTDSTLPKGTPILVDRWFEPWNEIKAHPTTNVFFTFTIPNEPPETYIKYHWRDTAKQFFERYPDAVYLEVAKSYWQVPGIGSWEWPRQYFARHVGITNEAGLKLRDLGLANRGDFYAADTNRVVLEIFYNTPEDVMAKARASGRPVIALYGGGWGYIKPNWQNGDFRDWRTLEGEAVVSLCNLTDHALPVRLKVRAAAVNGSKQVTAANGTKNTFPMGQMAEWDVGAFNLQPGATAVRLADPYWPASQALLLVDGFQVEPLPAPEATPAVLN